MDYKRIVAHSDFDGIASASLCMLMYGKMDVAFSGPVDINMRKMPLSETDVIVDLPYGTPAGLWYDHHEGNTEDVKLLGVDPDAIPGKRQVYPSCAGLIYDTFRDSFPFPEFIPELVTGVNRVDSFSYADIADWRRETPDRIIDLALKADFDSRREQFSYMREMAYRLMKTPVGELVKEPDILSNYKRTKENEDRGLQLIDKILKVADPETGRFLLLDFSDFKTPIRVNRSLAFLKEPSADVVIAVLPLFDRGVKTTDLMFSMSLAIHAAGRYDLGDIVRTLNIGDGHTGAASGKLESHGKAEMLKAKDKTLEFILKTLKEQAGK
jgi:hypothetical protein